MDSYWKATALVILTVILGLAIGKTEKDFSVLLSLMACCIALAAAVSYLKPVFDLLMELSTIGTIKNSVLGILLKAVGISLTSEIAGTLCTDAGNSSLGKVLHFLGSAAILYLSVPIFDSILTLIQEIIANI